MYFGYMVPNHSKGVILAAGRGTRLKPLTDVTSKILLPVFDRPMILSPLETLKNMGVNDICIVTGREYHSDFVNLLGDGSSYGVKLTYIIQDKPLGIAHALLQAEDFFGEDKVVAILGDNMFDNFVLPNGVLHDKNAYIFIKEVAHPQGFGVAQIEGDAVVGIEEKPKAPKSNFVVTGLYIFPNDVFAAIKNLKPSDRGEYEITDVNNHYLLKGNLKAHKLYGYWLDTGSFESLLKASIMRALHIAPALFEGIDIKALEDKFSKI